jgi:uncharacterized protein (TIGR03086 family)
MSPSLFASRTTLPRSAWLASLAMSEHGVRYARVAEGFSARVDEIAADQWDAPTPCPLWTVRDLVGHVVAVHRAIVADRDVAPAPPPATDTDLAAAWHGATADVMAALADPERATAPVTGRFAPMPFEQLVGMLGCFDTLVHTWDLARAIGADERLDAGAVAFSFEALRPNDDAIRGEGSYGPKLEPPPGADEQARFLAFLGRRVSRPPSPSSMQASPNTVRRSGTSA